jgi:hypothetical protein
VSETAAARRVAEGLLRRRRGGWQEAAAAAAAVARSGLGREDSACLRCGDLQSDQASLVAAEHKVHAYRGPAEQVDCGRRLPQQQQQAWTAKDFSHSTRRRPSREHPTRRQCPASCPPYFHATSLSGSAPHGRTILSEPHGRRGRGASRARLSRAPGRRHGRPHRAGRPRSAARVPEQISAAHPSSRRELRSIHLLRRQLLGAPAQERSGRRPRCHG